MTGETDERLRRWRLILGGGDADGIGQPLIEEDRSLDAALAMLYGSPEADGKGKGKSKRGGSGSSAPNVARWLGDVRKYFPSSVVKVMQKDALEKFNLRELLLEPEMLENVEPDVNLVATIISLNSVISPETRETARAIVRKLVDELLKRLEEPMRQAVSGSIDRTSRRRRPRHSEIDWNRTIRLNLKNYQREYRTVIPETLIGYGRKQRRSTRDIVLCVDQSGSMAPSVIYSSIFGAVMASLPTVTTKMILFDTAVVDLTEDLQDPVDLLFGAQLGGGTDINKALAYCQGMITRPQETIFVLISDLCEGGNAKEMIKRAAQIVESGAQFIALLALDDSGTPSYDHEHAKIFAQLGIPCFGCTPDHFPDLMAAAIQKRDLAAWAAERGIVSARGTG